MTISLTLAEDNGEYFATLRDAFDTATHQMQIESGRTEPSLVIDQLVAEYKEGLTKGVFKAFIYYYLKGRTGIRYERNTYYWNSSEHRSQCDTL